MARMQFPDWTSSLLPIYTGVQTHPFGSFFLDLGAGFIKPNPILRVTKYEYPKINVGQKTFFWNCPKVHHLCVSHENIIFEKCFDFKNSRSESWSPEQVFEAELSKLSIRGIRKKWSKWEIFSGQSPDRLPHRPVMIRSMIRAKEDSKFMLKRHSKLVSNSKRDLLDHSKYQRYIAKIWTFWPLNSVFFYLSGH